MVGHTGVITLLDPRGTLVGWGLRLVLEGSRSERVLLVPGRARAVTGLQAEVRRGRSAMVVSGQSASLMSAGPGGGGGEFETTARVVIEHPSRTPRVLSLLATAS
jgi:hypothetical protein